MPSRDEIPPGTLCMLILKTLARHGQIHGYEIAGWIQQISDDVLQVEEGSLYPALQRMLTKRMLTKGWITGEWGVTEGNRRARYYRLARLGRRQLEDEPGQYRRVSQAIFRVIESV